jgi:NAD-dependent dihydropyrimidine dehydrogenase PreA subunit
VEEETRSSDKVKVVVDPEKCNLSGECMKVCPEMAIYVKEGKAAIDQDKCNLDGICIAACPNGAIHFTDK